MVRVCRVVPKEWSKYNPVGNVIPRTRFIVFKTPLNDSLLTRVPSAQRFNVSGLLWKIAEKNGHLGLVIDLTDTDRYYDKTDIEGMCIKYTKINCPGRGFIENEDHVDDFVKAVSEFLQESDDKECLIGVHCTHGVNRSGYLICRFLIDTLGWSSHEALSAFEEARGHPISNGSYVQALHKASMRRINDSESDDSSRKKKKKQKRKRDRKEHDDSRHLGSMMQQFIGQIEEQAQVLESNSGFDSSAAIASGYIESSHHHWAFQQPKRHRAEGSEQAVDEGAEEEIVDYADEAEEGEYADDAEDDEEVVSKSQKRRGRRNRMRAMLGAMRRGNFHEIQEAQEEYLRGLGGNPQQSQPQPQPQPQQGM